ncbi:MAG: GTPase ObgE [Verrucomicrobiales bacterium]|jgi:GTP-binding protein|nr:GTPase ObgE [Verrucomicrobiales bacterium]
MFVDRVRVWAKAGKGGDGCSSFRREKYVPRGGPDGGDGGQGGDVVLEVDAQLNNLQHLKYQPHQYAGKGANGQGAMKTGKSARALLIKVPPGTLVYYLPTAAEDFERAADLALGEVAADMVEPGQRLVLAAGGRGGRGNIHFKSSVNQAPRRRELGLPGEMKQYYFELKSIAEVGLVGFPNAGKSSLLAALSRAHPKIAPYPFTTLTPVIGQVEVGDYRRFNVADIPGLIEGAHAGVGLGHDFLRHIERCRLLVFVLDMAGTEGREPAADYRQLRTELKLYDENLAQRPFLIAANKMDLPEAAARLKAFKRQFRRPIVPVSARQPATVAALKQALADRLAEA